MDNKKRFDGKGEIYAKARPKYATELLEYLKQNMGISESAVFADIGSGTGIFTEQLLDCGYKVFAVEPNEDMRKNAEKKLRSNKRFVSVNGNDENTNLPDNSVDCITVAQAFHWFNHKAFKNECKRILKPNGKVIIVYNSRNENAECTKALFDLRSKYNSEFHGFSNGISSKKCIDFFNKNCKIFHADNTQTYDKNGYIKRVLSSSYSLDKDNKFYSEYLEGIGKIFDKSATNGVISIPTETVAYIGTI